LRIEPVSRKTAEVVEIRPNARRVFTFALTKGISIKNRMPANRSTIPITKFFRPEARSLSEKALFDIISVPYHTNA
jgi:hypothetical protein